MFIHKRLFLILALAAWLATACSPAGGPKQIAAAQRLTPIAAYPGSYPIIYQAYIELQVDDVDDSAWQAQTLAARYSGYLADSQSWYSDGQKVSQLQLNVPAANFNALLQALQKLGVLLDETISGRPADGIPVEPGTYSSITLLLHQPAPVWKIAPEDDRWSPGRTFRSAFDVFLTIFGFLADVVIWVVVVAGPFVLIFALGLWVARYLRRRS